MRVSTRPSARLDEAITRLDRLERRQTEGDIRVATELTAVANGVAALSDLLSRKLVEIKLGIAS
jgi:hypothetical protein